MPASCKLRRKWAAAISCTAVPLALSPAPVRAGPVEQLVDIAFGPGTTPTIVTRYAQGGGGLVYGVDAGRSWRLQCASALQGLMDDSAGAPVILASGTALFATPRGVIAVSQDGCGSMLESTGEHGQAIDVVADPSDDNCAFSLVSRTNASAPMTALQHRSADGVWSTLGAPQDVVALSLRAANRTGGLRIY